MTSVIKHTLRASAASPHSVGWRPRLAFQLGGPTPAGAELVWNTARPDGSPWFEHRVAVPQLGDGETTRIDLLRQEPDADLAEPGTAEFSLKLVSELEGVDQSLHEGSFTTEALPGEHRYAVDNDWMLGLALLNLDSVNEPDAPRFRVTVFVKGDVDVARLEAYCFHQGGRIATALFIESRHSFTASDGSVVGHEIVAEFDSVRGWNNLRASGWGAPWHLLDEHDGRYEVKLVRASKVARVLAFDVVAGRIVAPAFVEPDPWSGATVVVDAEVQNDLDGEWSAEGAPAFYGDVVTAPSWSSIDQIYAARIAPESEQAEDEDEFDPATAEALQHFIDRAALLLGTWESIFADGQPPYDSSDILKAEMVCDEESAYLELREAAASVADSQPVDLFGEQTTVGHLRARTAGLFATARARISGAAEAESDSLAPYRALLAGDKLAVFEEHPIGSFVYTTIDRKVIETPDELAEAEYWFFEGPLTTPGSARVDGVDVTVSVQGWKVLGWRFDGAGAAIDRFETRGQGGSAPISAYQRDR
jgi:hypothetical protein